MKTESTSSSFHSSLFLFRLVLRQSQFRSKDSELVFERLYVLFFTRYILLRICSLLFRSFNRNPRREIPIERRSLLVLQRSLSDICSLTSLKKFPLSYRRRSLELKITARKLFLSRGIPSRFARRIFQEVTRLLHRL